MESDTVIGIVGAVVLVAVMVGVFAYEYNNAPETGDHGPDLGTEAGQREAFATAYPDYDADQDYDGDGTPNFEDDDLDGDGTPNAEDARTEVTIVLTGDAPSNPNPTGEGSPATLGQFVTGNGHIDYSIEVSHDLGTVGQERALVTAGAAGSCITGQDGTCGIEPTGETGEGSVYSVETRQTAFNPNALSVTVTITVTYG